MNANPGMAVVAPRAGPRYQVFASVRVSHDYFADGRPPRMLFSPHADTAAFLRRFDMHLRVDGASLGIGVCDAQWANIWSERLDEGVPRTLCFDVRPADPDSAYYTAVVTAADQVADDTACPAPLQEVAASAGAPLATLLLPLNPALETNLADWVASVGVHYRLHLRSRSTIWKYVLVGDWRERKLTVADPRGEVTFTAPAPERMPDGSTALVARSTAPIMLHERPAQRFQLRDITDTPARILIPRLPGARPQGLWREVLGGEPTAVSEIFVHC